MYMFFLSVITREHPLNKFFNMIKKSGSLLALFKIYVKIYFNWSKYFIRVEKLNWDVVDIFLFGLVFLGVALAAWFEAVLVKAFFSFLLWLDLLFVGFGCFS